MVDRKISAGTDLWPRRSVSGRDLKAKSVQGRRVYTPLTAGGLGDRRSGHSSDRTVCRADRPDRPFAWNASGSRPSTTGHRCRAGVPGGGAGAAALRQRAALAAGGVLAGGAPVSAVAVPKRVQPAAEANVRPDGGRTAVAGRTLSLHRRQGPAD